MPKFIKQTDAASGGMSFEMASTLANADDVTKIRIQNPAGWGAPVQGIPCSIAFKGYPRMTSQQTALLNNRLFFVGGLTGDSQPSAYVDCFDLTTKSSRLRANYPLGGSASYGVAACVMNSVVYCLGGGGTSVGGNQNFYSYDYDTDAFTALSNPPSATRNSCMAAHSSTVIIAHPGYTANSTTVPGGLWTYTEGSGWATANANCHAFADAGIASDGTRAYLLGGINSSGAITSTVTTVTVATGAIVSDYLPPLPYATRFITAFVQGGYLYAVGGTDPDSNIADTGYTSSPKNTAAMMFSYRINLTDRESWEPWPIPMGPRKGAVIAYDSANDRLLVAGGLYQGQQTSVSDGLSIIPNFTKFFIMNRGA